MFKQFLSSFGQVWSTIKRRTFSNLRYFLVFFVITELLYILVSLTEGFYIKHEQVLNNFQYLLILFSTIFVLILTYCLVINIIKIYKSFRWDIVLSAISGLMLFISLHNNILNQNLFTDWSAPQFPDFKWFILMPVSIILFIFAYLLKNNKNKSYFLSDDALDNPNLDSLGYTEDAEIFATQVLNNMSKDSFVFGLDAPWGMGKSSYINLCKNFWKENENVIVIDFEPLRFESNESVFKNFINELINGIRKDSFAPEIQNTFYKYVFSILNNIKVGFSYLSLSFTKNDTNDVKFNALKDELKFYNKKIIVIIDDLDRLQTEYVKTILDIVKKSFTLPNITYVLCYDTENLSQVDHTLKITESVSSPSEGKTTKTVEREKIDNEKLIEYIEKIVNIKKTLVIPRSKIRDYLVKKIEEININQKLPIFPKASMDKITTAIDYIFAPDQYYKYIKYLGDLRKIKRFLNIFKMQVAYNLDIVHNLSKNDIDFLDLIHLMLLYINYPKVFRKIYNTETDGGKEFFSLKMDFISDDGFRYKNSPEYVEYFERLSDDEKFLVSQLFDYKKFDTKDKKFELIKATSAAFNGTLMSARNLEDYIKVIVNRVQPNIADSYTIHQSNVLSFLKGELNLEQIFSNEIYKLGKDNNGEKYRSIFYRTLTNNIDELTPGRAKNLIDFMLNDLKKYSAVEQEDTNLGLRKGLTLDILFILDKRGWKDGDGKNYHNTKENIIGIAKYIFGDEPFQDSGILKKLSKINNILDLVDLLHFRLYCNQDRGGQMYNLYNALQYHHNDAAQTNGVIRDLLVEEMREITQNIFAIFNSEYILNSKNIFDEINNLTAQDIFNSSLPFINTKQDTIKITELIEREKSLLKLFISYQIATKNIEMGIGMGYYDETGGGDTGQIREKFIKYLYDTCFDPTSDKNIGHFINFLLINLNSRRDIYDTKYVPDLKYYDRILDKDKLLEYWGKNKTIIIDYARNTENNKLIYTYNYTTTYEDLDKIFDMLDEKLSQLPITVTEND